MSTASVNVWWGLHPPPMYVVGKICSHVKPEFPLSPMNN